MSTHPYEHAHTCLALFLLNFWQNIKENRVGRGKWNGLDPWNPTVDFPWMASLMSAVDLLYPHQPFMWNIQKHHLYNILHLKSSYHAVPTWYWHTYSYNIFLMLSFSLLLLRFHSYYFSCKRVHQHVLCFFFIIHRCYGWYKYGLYIGWNIHANSLIRATVEKSNVAHENMRSWSSATHRLQTGWSVTLKLGADQ